MKIFGLFLLGVLAISATMPEGKTSIIRYSPDDLASVDVEGDNEVRSHNYYTSERNDRITSGVWEAAQLVSEPYMTKYSEFIYLLDGSLTLIDGDGREETFHAGDAALIPRGMMVTWKQPEKLRKYWVIFDHETAETTTAVASEPTPTFIRLDSDGPAGVGLKGKGQTISHQYYAGNSRSTVGVWETAPHKPADFHTAEFAELMIFLKGTVTLVEPDGEQTFGPGDVALVPKGTEFKWSSDTARKYWVIFDNEPSPATSQ